ncbi:hypothetical protein OAJ94_00465 [Deltaproteobacteria bacterium]|nr:hypothetical protein [Deltaproteobacteria bacterium]
MWPFPKKEKMEWLRLDDSRKDQYSQKLYRRMLYDREPILITMEDKYKARELVASKGVCKLPELLWWSCQTPVKIPWDELPDRFVIKTNHWSGDGIYFINNSNEKLKQIAVDMTIGELYRVIENGIDHRGKKVSHAWMEKKLTRLLKKKYAKALEWGTQEIKPAGVMIEKMLMVDGALPDDVKFHVFHGKVGWIQIDVGRFTEHRQSIYNVDGSRIEQSNPKFPGIEELKHLHERFSPQYVEEMVRVAEKLCEDIDYTRLDLFDIDGELYFGEYTCYHNAAHPQSDEWEELGGRLWKTDY